MPLPNGFIDELLDRCNITQTVSSYVRLKRTGANYVGLCPFHSEKTPSFTVSEDKQLFKCFGCGEGGNVISFVMKMENLPFIDAVRKLCEENGMTFPEDDGREFSMRRRILDLNRAAAKFFYKTLISEQGKPALNYLLKRGLTKSAITSFGLGCAPNSWDALTKEMMREGFTVGELEAAKLAGRGKNGGYYDFFRDRVMFPIIDVRGDVIAFSGRVLTSGAEGRKYINSPDTPVYNKSRALYGINIAKKTKQDFLLLVEGNMDVVSLHSAGIDNAIATCGTALTSQQAQLMKKYAQKAVICFDRDAAGQKATDKAIGILSAADIEVRVLRLPQILNEHGEPIKDDPDSFIRRSGADAFKKLLSKPPSDIEYRLSEIAKRADTSSDDGRISYLKESARYLATIPGDIEREIFTRNTARNAGLSEESLLSEVKRIRGAMIRERKRKTERQASNPVLNAQPRERGIRYVHPASAISEERLLSICLSDTALLKKAGEAVKPFEFSSPLLASVYEKALSMSDAGNHVSPAALLTDLPENETRHITAVLTRAIPSGDTEKELAVLIEKIKLDYKKRSGSGDLLSAVLAEKRKKG